MIPQSADDAPVASMRNSGSPELTEKCALEMESRGSEPNRVLSLEQKSTGMNSVPFAWSLPSALFQTTAWRRISPKSPHSDEQWTQWTPRDPE